MEMKNSNIIYALIAEHTFKKKKKRKQKGRQDVIQNAR